MTDAFTSLLLAALLESGDARTPRAPSVVAQTLAQPPDAGDVDVVKRAQAILTEVQAGKLDRAQLSATLNGEYTPTVLANVSRTIPAGAPSRFEIREKLDSNGTTVYVFRVWWDAGSLDYTFGFDDGTKQLVKLYFRPGPPA